MEGSATATLKEAPRSALLDRIRDILPDLAARAQATEEARRMLPENVALLKQVGFLQGLVPASRGGGEESLLDWLQAVRLISSACASTGWASAVLGIHAHGLTAFSKQLQDEVWSTGADTLVCTSSAPVGKVRKVEAGYELSGRFPFSSGSDYASWAMVGFAFVDDVTGKRSRYLAAVPRADFTIDDTWYASGLQGTGSNDLVIDAVFVPEYRTRNQALETPCLAPGLYDNGLYTLPFHSAWSVMFAAIVLGAAEGAIGLYKKRLTGRVKANTGLVVAEHLPTQMRLSESTMELRSAACLLERHWTELDRRARERLTVTLEDMRYWRAEDAYASRLAVRAIDRIMEGTGGSAYYRNNDLQRFRRDLHVANQHTFLDCDSAYQVLARDLLGLPRDPNLMFS